MAKVKEESALEIASWNREQIGKQREKGVRIRVVMEDRIEELRSRFATMTHDERKEFMSLRENIPVEKEIEASLTVKEQEQDRIVQQLTQEKARQQAGDLCLAVELDFTQVVLAVDLMTLEAWLSQASGAQNAYQSANGRVNLKIERMRLRLADLVARIREVHSLLER